MKIKLLVGALCLIATSANAAIPYRVRQVTTPPSEIRDGNDAEALARVHRFYVGGMYDFSAWQSYTDQEDVRVDGKNTSSFDIVAGLRVYDTLRIEANYTRTNAKWNGISLHGDTLFLNAVIDARIDNIYRLFRSQHLVPYVGAGVGLSGNKVDGAKIDDKFSATLGVMAGLGVELGEYFTIDAGYRYMYMFTPNFDVVKDLAPTAHQLRVGARINF